MQLLCISYVLAGVMLWTLCCICCERGRYVRPVRKVPAFRARTPFQRSLTALQSRRFVHRKDLGSITWVGYAISCISAFVVLGIAPVCLYLHLRGVRWAAGAAAGGYSACVFAAGAGWLAQFLYAGRRKRRTLKLRPFAKGMPYSGMDKGRV